MGRNASPFIADLYLAWDEYCFMELLSKSKSDNDRNLAKLLSNNCRYIDDISVINFLGFGNIAKNIYHPSLVLENSGYGFHFDTFLDLLIRIHNRQFIIGIYHKVDDFNFEVINFPFPSSNIHSETGYISFYSQLVRFFRLCDNVTDFSVRVSMIRYKLCVRGYEVKTLYKYFSKFCSHYPVVMKFGVSDVDSLWDLTMNSNVKSCNVLDQTSVKNIIKPSKIVLTDTYGHYKKMHSRILKDCSVKLTDIAIYKSATIELNKETLPTKELIPERPFGLDNPRNHCYINSVLQILIRVLSTCSYDVRFNNNEQGSLTKDLFNLISTRNIKDLYHLKTSLTKYDRFF